MHGSNRLGGNSLSDLLVFGRRAGLGAAEYVAGLAGNLPQIPDDAVRAASAAALAPFESDQGENPYTLHQELQQTMNDLVGIIRKEAEMAEALDRLAALKARATQVTVEGHRQFNPGWHLALDLKNMIAVSECVAKAALLRQESRGGHTRDDYPQMSADWRQNNLICRADYDEFGMGEVTVTEQPIAAIRADLLSLFERDELAKYLTDAELPAATEANR